MKRKFLLLSLVILSCFFTGAFANELVMRSSEKDALQNIIGEHPKQAVESITASSSAREVLLWLYATEENVSVDDRIRLYQRMLQDIDAGGPTHAASLRLTMIENELNASLLNRLQYYSDRISHAVVRIEDDLERLESEKDEAEIRRMTLECRFLQDQLRNDMSEVLELSKTVDETVNAAEASLLGFEEEDHLLGVRPGSPSDIRTVSADQIERQEQIALTRSAGSVTADVASENRNAVITVLNEKEFAIKVWDKDSNPIQGVTVRIGATDGTPESMISATTGDNGLAIFQTAQFPFKDGKLAARIEVSADGYRKLEIAKTTVKAAGCVQIPLNSDDGSVYISEASFKQNDMLLDPDNGIYCAAANKNQYPIYVRIRNLPQTATEGKVYLRVRDSKGINVVDLELGSFTASNGIGTLSVTDTYGSKVELKNVEETYQLQLVVAGSGFIDSVTSCAFTMKKAIFEESRVSDASLPSLLTGGLTIPLLDMRPMLDAMSMDVSTPLMPKIGFSVDWDLTFVLCFGSFQKTKPGSAYELKESATLTERKEEVEYLCSVFNEQLNDCRKASESMGGKKNKWNPFPDKKPLSWNITASGGIRVRARVNSESLVKQVYNMDGEGWATATISCKYNYVQQLFLPPPIFAPVYYGFDISGSVTAGLEAGVSCLLDLRLPEPEKGPILDVNFQPVCEIPVTLKVEIGGSAGVGFCGLATAGIRAYGNCAPSFIFKIPLKPGMRGDIMYQVSFGVGLNVEIKTVFFNSTVHLVNKTFKIPADGPKSLLDDPYEYTVAPLPNNEDPVLVAQNVGRYSQLPETNEGVLVMPGTPVVRGDPSGIAPISELRYSGNFVMTNLLGLTLTNDGGDNTDLVFFCGDNSDFGFGYNSINYATTEGDQLVVRGAVIDPHPERNGFVTDFTAAWDQEAQQLYLLYVYGLAERDNNDEGWHMVGTATELNIYSFDFSSEKLVPEKNVSFYPTSESGHTEIVNLFKPQLMLDPSSKLVGFAMAGESLQDTDSQGQPLGHEKGTFLYYGFSDPETMTSGFWRYADQKIDSPEEIVNIALMPGYGFMGERVSGSEYSMQFGAAVLTGLRPDENSAVEGSKIYYSNLKVIRESAVHSAPSLPIPGKPALAMTKMREITAFHASNILSGFERGEILLVEDNVTDDGIGESMLSSLTFNWNDTEYIYQNYGFSASMGWFGVTHLAGGSYLYWANSYDETVSEPQGDQRSAQNQSTRSVIRCCLYDEATHSFTTPFDLVELAFVPKTVALTSSDPVTDGKGLGLYTTTSNDSSDEQVLWNFVSLEYQLQTSLELETFYPVSDTATAGKPATLRIIVENTGNTLVSDFDVHIRGDNDINLADIHINTQQQDQCSMMLYESDGRASYTGNLFAVHKTPGFGELQVGDMLCLTTVEKGESSFRMVSARGILPGQRANYTVEITIPASWDGQKNLTAYLSDIKTPKNLQRVFVGEEDTADTVPGVFAEREIQNAKAAFGMDSVPAVNYGRRISCPVAWTMDDYDLDVKRIFVNGREYLQVLITNEADGRIGENHDCIPPTLEFFKVMPDQTEIRTFSHTFARDIHSDHSYTLIIPLDLVDGDGRYTELRAVVSGNGIENEDFNLSNNKESIFGSLHNIVVKAETEGMGTVRARNASGATVAFAEAGESIELIAEPLEGFRFVGWESYGIPVRENIFEMPGYDVTFVARFDIAEPEIPETGDGFPLLPMVWLLLCGMGVTVLLNTGLRRRDDRSNRDRRAGRTGD